MTSQNQTFTRADCQNQAVILYGILQGIDSILNDTAPVNGGTPNSVYTLVQVAREKAGELSTKLDDIHAPKRGAGQ